MVPEGGEHGMKKAVSKETLVKEAIYWNALKHLATLNPGAVCHK